jgi:dTDP-4-dehydrorhamnose 3,5-epimerase
MSPDHKIYEVSPDKRLHKNIYSTAIDGLLVMTSDVYPDARGFFREVSIIPDIEKVTGGEFRITQINHAHSEQNVIRGFHIGSWSKLVTVTSGSAFCVLVDVRPTSVTFQKTEYIQLGCGDGALVGSLFIPKGLANSVCVTGGPLDYLYAVDKVYKDRKENEDLAFSLFDPAFGVAWPIPREQMIMSERDKSAPLLSEIRHLL